MTNARQRKKAAAQRFVPAAVALRCQILAVKSLEWMQL